LGESRVRIPCRRHSGDIVLEGRLHIPGGHGPFSGAVVCHPHPMGGGEMGVPLVRLICEELSARGAAALRFNFGGVAGSTGTFTDGADEPEDVFAAFEYLEGLDEVRAGSVGLAGWSFGSWMALRALAHGLPARACAVVAPPLDFHQWEEVALRLASSGATRHYIVGEFDQFCSPDALQEFAAAISPEDALNVTVLPDADHFLFGRESEVVSLVADFLS
jgi:uncharacterized protein